MTTPSSEKLGYATIDSLVDYARARADLSGSMRRLAEHLTWAAANIENGERWNTTGEIQSRGPAIDIQCALVGARREQAQTLLRLLGNDCPENMLPTLETAKKNAGF